MPEASRRIETAALVVGYAMSRLDRAYLTARGTASWAEAYRQAAASLGVPEASLKNLRDEYDPYNANARRGWHQRPLRPDRQRVLDELSEVTDDALAELVHRIISQDLDTISIAIDSLADVRRTSASVAERLLTGRRAEDYFLNHTEPLMGVHRSRIVDCRNDARGFDFGVRDRPEIAIEVKGIKQIRGNVQFTDREWAEARGRGTNYVLVVVSNLAAEPKAWTVEAPHVALPACASYRTSVTTVWTVRVDGANHQ